MRMSLGTWTWNLQIPADLPGQTVVDLAVAWHSRDLAGHSIYVDGVVEILRGGAQGMLDWPAGQPEIPRWSR